MNAPLASPPSTTLAYTGHQTGYMGTGFSFDWICRNDIVEDHPAIMRYEAFKRWANKTWPTRGTRPAWAADQLMRLSGNKTRAKDSQTPAQVLGYKERTAVRNVQWIPVGIVRGEQWTGPAPVLPHVSVPRGRSKVAITERTRPLVRPWLSWRDQVLRDHGALHQLGHPIPRSERPSQTFMGKRPDGRGFELQAVPLMDAYHSWLSCNGRFETGGVRPCPFCCKDGKHTGKRQLTAGPLPEKVVYAPEVDEEIARTGRLVAVPSDP